MAKPHWTLIIVGFVLLLSSCSPGNMELFVKQLQPVQDFLEQHPDANIRVVYWDNEATRQNEALIISKCGQMLPLKRYWFAYVEEEGTSLSMFIDDESRQPVCAFREGKKSGQPPGEESPEEFRTALVIP